MNPYEYARVCDLFGEAKKLTPGERDTFLDQACRDTPALRAQVLKLLAHDEVAERDGFLRPLVHGRAAIGSDLSDLDDAIVGTTIGPYQIQKRIDSGGMGSVFLARRVTDFEQVVALKLIRRGMDDGEFIRRFRAERQVLANLDHPHIARLLDGGSTEDGRPYFVMEYIGGEPIDDFCERRQLATDDRVRLVQQIALAVDHAHKCGVIHRDLKPSNVLVTADGTPKVTDFGLAKQVTADNAKSKSADANGRDRKLRVSDGKELTGSGAIIGTPGYMAPEQAKGKWQQVTQATDVYALGAILYELLTGRPPFRSDTPLNTILLILSDEVVPPRRLNPKVPCDLETICLKCLEKEAAKRYQTARALAEDLARLLAGEPIHARPIGHFEQGLRWCRRRPAVTALLATLAAVVVASFLGLYSLYAVAETRRQTAETSRQAADENFELVLNFINEHYSPTKVNRQPVGSESLEAAITHLRELSNRRPSDPELRFQLATALGRLSQSKPGADRSELIDLVEQSLAVLEPLCENYPARTQFHSKLAAILESKALVLEDSPNPSDQQERMALYERSSKIRERLVSENPDEIELYSDLYYTYRNRAEIHVLANKLDEALTWLYKARDVREATYNRGPDPIVLQRTKEKADAYAYLARVQGLNGQSKESIQSLTTACQIMVDLAASKPGDTSIPATLAAYYSDLGNAQGDANDWAAASESYRHAAEILASLIAQDALRPSVLKLRDYLAKTNLALGDAYERDKQLDAALLTYEKARELCQQLVQDQPDNLQ